jgi:hypothetical protein
MKLKQIIKILKAELLTSKKGDPDIKMCGGSDLMSDVLFYVKPESMLLTGLTNLQVIYTASTAGIRVICFVRGKKPPKETVELAEKKNVVLITTKFPMFESCGRLHEKGLLGILEAEGVLKK